ncbi:hypothetical protein KXX29_002936, partial [Aspergillus fumigatus]
PEPVRGGGQSNTTGTDGQRVDLADDDPGTRTPGGGAGPPAQNRSIIAVITPYMVDTDKGNLKAKVFFIWGSLCACAFVYTYFLIPETKGLTLEQVDKMMEETTPRTSAKWKPHGTFAAEMGLTDKDMAEKTAEVVHQEV